MKPILTACALCLLFALPGGAAHQDIGAEDQRREDAPDHGVIGEPADGATIDRIIDVTITETLSGYMLFEPDAIQIEAGSVVRFVINNSGALDHEFFLGSFAEVAAHQQLMRKHPQMDHTSPNAVSVTSGETAELTWRFSATTNLEFACLIPGHREAGMWGVVIVHDHLAKTPKN